MDSYDMEGMLTIPQPALDLRQNRVYRFGAHIGFLGDILGPQGLICPGGALLIGLTTNNSFRAIQSNVGVYPDGLNPYTASAMSYVVLSPSKSIPFPFPDQIKRQIYSVALSSQAGVAFHVTPTVYVTRDLLNISGTTQSYVLPTINVGPTDTYISLQENVVMAAQDGNFIFVTVVVDQDLHELAPRIWFSISLQ